jgi:hypothetical protein
MHSHLHYPATTAESLCEHDGFGLGHWCMDIRLWMLLFKCNMQTTVLAPLAPLDLVPSYSIPDKYFHW